MSRSVKLFAVAVVAVLMLSAAMPASAQLNLLQNPGFETGGMYPWVWGWIGDGDGGVKSNGAHTGTYYAWIEVEETSRAIKQEINPRCAQYLEFWYRGGWEDDGDLGFEIHYSDDYLEEGLSETEDWTLVHIELDTAKLVTAVEVGVSAAYGVIDVDDFNLEACPEEAAPVGGPVGGFVEPVNMAGVFAPYLALFGVIATVAVVVWKKRKN